MCKCWWYNFNIFVNTTFCCSWFSTVLCRLTEFQKMLLFLRENIQYFSMELMRRKYHIYVHCTLVGLTQRFKITVFCYLWIVLWQIQFRVSRIPQRLLYVKILHWFCSHLIKNQFELFNSSVFCLWIDSWDGWNDNSISYINSPENNFCRKICWRFGSRCCLLRTDSPPGVTAADSR